jgi:hypothetical protein
MTPGNRQMHGANSSRTDVLEDEDISEHNSSSGRGFFILL